MAYYNDNQDEDNQGGAAQPTAPAGGSTIQGGGAGAPTTPQAPAASPTGAATAAKGPTHSSNFVGINQYLNANKPQTQKLANTLGNYASQGANQAKSQLAGAENTFNKQIEDNTVGFNDTVANEIRNDAEGVLADQNKAASVRRMGQAYQGPTDLASSQGFQQAQTTGQKAVETGNKLGNQTTQSELLRDMQKEQRGKVNQGAALLDQGLISNSQEAKNTLKGYQQDINKLPQTLQEAMQRGLEKGTAAKATTDDANKRYQDLFFGDKGIITGENANLQRKAGEANLNQKKTLETNQNVLNNFLQGQGLSDEGLNLLGITRDQQNELYDLAQNYAPEGNGLVGDKLGVLGNYAKLRDPSLATSENVASAEDRARLGALYSLASTKNQLAPSAGFQNQNDLLDYDAGGALNYLRGLKGNAMSLQAEKDKAAADEAEKQAGYRRAAAAAAAQNQNTGGSHHI